MEYAVTGKTFRTLFICRPCLDSMDCIMRAIFHFHLPLYQDLCLISKPSKAHHTGMSKLPEISEIENATLYCSYISPVKGFILSVERDVSPFYSRSCA